MAHRIHVDTRAFTATGRLCFAIATMSLLVLTSCAVFTGRYYSAEPIKARVVDEETKQPIEGVVVVAQWILMRGGYSGRIPVGTLHVLETVTDANGNFSFPAWGPLANTTEGSLDREDPIIWFFKPGYGIGGISNHISYSDKPSRRKWERSGTTIELEIFKGTKREYALHVGSRPSNLLENPNPNLLGDCHFTKTPLMAAAIDVELQALEKQGYQGGGFRISLLLPEYAAKCGFVRPPIAKL